MSLMYTPVSMGLHASPSIRKKAARQSRKPDWKPDNTTRLCVGCKKRFTITTRRHHCRRCGNIFCSACSSARKALHPTFGYGNAVVRQCRWCCSFDEDLFLLQMDEMDCRQGVYSRYYQGFQSAMLHLLPKILNTNQKRVLSGVLNQPSGCTATPPMTPPLTPSISFFDHKYDKTAYMSQHVQEISYLIATGISDSYLKDRRINLKTYKSVFTHDEVSEWLSSNISSLSASDLLKFLQKTAIIEHVGEKLYKLKDANVTAIVEKRQERLADPPEKENIEIGDTVAYKGKVKEYYLKEIKGDRYVISGRIDTEEAPKSEIIASPFSKVAEEVRVVLCGTVKDLNQETIQIVDVQYDLVKFSYLMMKYIKGHLLSEHTLAMKQYTDVFDGSAVTDLTMTMANLSETDAIDFGELFHKMGLISPIAGYSEVSFDGTYQLFKVSSSTLASLEYCLGFKRKSLSKDRSNFEIGDTVFVTAFGTFHHREGFVTEYVSSEAVCVSFPDGDSWVFAATDLITSPATEVLQRSSGSERARTIHECVHLRNLAIVFVKEITRSDKKYIKESFWQGLSRYKGVFTGEDAIASLCELFPSLGSSNAVEVGTALMRGGLFTHPSEDTSMTFEKKNCFRFREESLKYVDDQYDLFEREAANNVDPSNKLPIGVSIPLDRLLEDFSENGSILEKLPEEFKKPHLARDTPEIEGHPTPSVLDNYDRSDCSLETISENRKKRNSGRFSVPPPNLPLPRPGSAMSLPPTTPNGPRRSQSTDNLHKANPNPLGRVSPNNRGGLFTQPDKTRSSTLPPNEPKAEVILDMVAFRKAGSQWYPHRFLLRADRTLERHVLVGRILNGTRLRKQPLDEGDVWIEPPAYVDQSDVVKIISIYIQNGYQQIRSSSVVGFIRSSNLELTESIESSSTAIDMSVSFSEVIPSDAELKALIGKESYSKGEWRNSTFVISHCGSVHHICCKSESDRDTWMAALKP